MSTLNHTLHQLTFAEDLLKLLDMRHHSYKQNIYKPVTSKLNSENAILKQVKLVVNLANNNLATITNLKNNK